MSVRRVSKSYRNVTAIIASCKAIDAANFQSMPERDRPTLLQFSPQARPFDIEPLTTEWCQAWRWHHYTPDMRVEYWPENGEVRAPLFAQVEYRNDLREQWLQFRPKLLVGVHCCKHIACTCRLRAKRAGRSATIEVPTLRWVSVERCRDG